MSTPWLVLNEGVRAPGAGGCEQQQPEAGGLVQLVTGIHDHRAADAGEGEAYHGEQNSDYYQVSPFF
jgi:hypothetical protein